MKVWNVAVAVVSIIEAETPAEAEAILTTWLEEAGFYVYAEQTETGAAGALEEKSGVRPCRKPERNMQ